MKWQELAFPILVKTMETPLYLRNLSQLQLELKQVWSTNRCVLSTFFQLNTLFLEFENNWLPTDGPTDGRTDPLIEMRGRI